MRYAVITVTDGNFLIRTEWDELAKAKKAYHNLATALLDQNAGFTKGYIAIMDSNLDVIPGYKEYIKHEPQPVVTPIEPVEEPVDDTEE